jgi:hypothetical protein
VGRRVGLDAMEEGKIFSSAENRTPAVQTEQSAWEDN